MKTKQVRRAEETAVKFRRAVRTPHNGKAEGVQKDNPIPAIGPLLGLLETRLERAGCRPRLCPPRRGQDAGPGSVLPESSQETTSTTLHAPERKGQAQQETQEKWNRRHDSSVRLRHKRKRAACREAQGNTGVCPGRGALPHLGTVIDLSDLPEQQEATHQPHSIACFTLYICRRLYLLQSRLRQKQ